MTTNEDFEDLVLACILHRADDCFTEGIRLGMTEYWFKKQQSVEAYLLFTKYWSDSRKLDVDVLETKMSVKGYLRYLKELYPSVTSFNEYLSEVKEAFSIRKLKEIIVRAGYLTESGVASEKVVADILDSATDLISPTEKLISNDEAIEMVLDKNQNPDVGGLPWFLEDLNRLIQPIQDQFIWVMAPPSVGKTAFMLQLSDSIGQRVDYIALESNQRDLIQRIISRRIERNILKPLSPQSLEQAQGLKGKLNHIVFTSAPNTIEKIRAYAKTAKARGSKLLVIDNLKHIRETKSYDSQTTKFLDFSMQLKHIRDDIDMPIIVVHHTNEDGTTRFSRDIDADSDITIKLSASDDSIPANPANNYTSTDYVMLDVEKNRDGMTPRMKIQFLKNIQMFRQLPRSSHES